MRIANALLLSSTVVTAAFAVGCGDPVPALPRGGYQASFGRAADTPCSIPAHNGQVGLVDSKSKDNLVTQGVDGANVSCEVVGDASFKVVGSVQQGDNGLTIAISKIDSSARQDSPALGNVGFASRNTARQQFQSESVPCEFYFQEGTSQGIDQGQIWVAFKCPEVYLGGVEKCAITQGYVAFDSCSIGEE